MQTNNVVTIDGKAVPIEGERNILEMCRKVNIDIPTFCYHSNLSVYGACRLCLVDVEGRGIVTSCSTEPAPGMVVKTNTAEIREMRKINIELLLANHDQSCPTCPKSGTCELQKLARRMGIREVRFKPTHVMEPIDTSSHSLVRDPNKCVLCGDCVRACDEVQGIGAIDFAHRGAHSAVLPAFGKDMAQVECVNCGQCAAVCPTGALTPKSEVEAVWKDIADEKKTVVAQIAPAVRVALGEEFGLAPGTVTTGQIVAALKALGFDQVYDTCFAADMTIFEEANEFLGRVQNGGKLPIFTSCCPAWVKFSEQYFPELLPHLSSCKSPQQMFGSTVKETMPATTGVERKDLVCVSIMPCTAKKFEAKRDEFYTDGNADVDHVLTTQELARMIEEAGLSFNTLSPESLDMPLGFKTGAGVIFGASGGVTEAVLRYAAEKVTGKVLHDFEFQEVRGEEGLREATVPVGDIELKLAIVHGLANARRLAEQVRRGESPYHIIEVMACPGGCVNGGGQPVTRETTARKERAKGLYAADRMLQLHKSQDNHMLCDIYEKHLGEIGGHKAHELLHTHYSSRRRMFNGALSLVGGADDTKLQVSVCVGTSCYLKGSQDLLKKLVQYVEENKMTDRVDVQATFCFEKCDKGPTVRIGKNILTGCTLESAVKTLDETLAALAK